MDLGGIEPPASAIRVKNGAHFSCQGSALPTELKAHSYPTRLTIRQKLKIFPFRSEGTAGIPQGWKFQALTRPNKSEGLKLHDFGSVLIPQA